MELNMTPPPDECWSDMLPVKTPAGLNEFQLTMNTQDPPLLKQTTLPSVTARIYHTSFALSGKQPQTFYIYFY